MQFARLEDAKAAQSLNGQLDIAGRVIKVIFHSNHVVYGTDNTWLIVHPFNTLVFSFNQVSAVTDHVGVQASGATTGDLDDDEGGGLVGELIWFNMLDMGISMPFISFWTLIFGQSRGFNLVYILQTESSEFWEVPFTYNNLTKNTLRYLIYSF
jgi:hypothetical protein